MIDLDATLVTSHSDKEHAAPTFKRGYGFHPLCAFGDHGPDGTGEALAILLRPGNAGSNTATDHIAVIRQALAQLPGQRPGHRPGRKVLVRTDGAGGTRRLIEWLTGRRLSYSVGFTLPANTPDLLAKIPDQAWTPAYDAHDQVRDGAWVAELTGLLELGSPGRRGCGSSSARNAPIQARSSTSMTWTGCGSPRSPLRRRPTRYPGGSSCAGSPTSTPTPGRQPCSKPGASTRSSPPAPWTGLLR